MKPKTVAEEILSYLEGCNQCVWGGQLAREIASRCKCKESVVERRARELVADEKINATYDQVNGKGPMCVKYHCVIKSPVKVEQTSLF